MGELAAFDRDLSGCDTPRKLLVYLLNNVDNIDSIVVGFYSKKDNGSDSVHVGFSPQNVERVLMCSEIIRQQVVACIHGDEEEG